MHPLCFLVSALPVASAFPSFRNLVSSAFPSRSTLGKRADNLTTPNYLWIIEDTYAGPTFFDRWNFFSGKDPTNGNVNYQNKTDAFEKQLVYVKPDNTVIMQADNSTWLEKGAFRDSVRIESIKLYTGGLFILDLDRAPWGCATWPAFWSFGANWPNNGEIDILEGVHDGQHNQITWHTREGCKLIPTSNYTGTSVVKTTGNETVSCYAKDNGNSGCGVTEWSRASYGPFFNENHGGVFAMKWDDTGIAVWSFFRAGVPEDIATSNPDPSLWGPPSASLAPEGCHPFEYFANHTLVFDITFCGDWAGNALTQGCPGACADRLMDPGNFANASWTINSVKTYQRQVLGRVTASGSRVGMSLGALCVLLVGVAVLL